MAVGYRISATGIKKVQRALRSLRPPESEKALGAGLLAAAKQVQRDAARNQIIAGGKGPVDPVRLTSRSGDLRRSIAINRTGRPRFIDVGTHLKYGRAHETGFGPKFVTVREHTRKVAFGRKTNKPFTVPSHQRKMHIKKRPFLKPAIEKLAPRFSSIFLQEIDKRMPR